MSRSLSRRPVVFGEVLFDNFPDGTTVLGGAPFNVAWHLQALGATPYFISRVGDDDSGNKVREIMRGWNMDIRGLQTDPGHPTGTVQVKLVNGQPQFTILPDQAYDFIAPDTTLGSLSDAHALPLLYHGTLAARATRSRTTLDRMRADHDLPVFVDVNLRAPWWAPSAVEVTLSRARWVKLNDDELATVLDKPLDADSLAADAAALRRRNDHEFVVVTRGADGALIATADGVIESPAPKIVNLVDTVGAGDAFSAVIIVGLLCKWEPALMLQRALEFAAAICSIRGATTEDRALYERRLAEWQPEFADG